MKDNQLIDSFNENDPALVEFQHSFSFQQVIRNLAMNIGNFYPMSFEPNIVYNGETLTRYQLKLAGKNQSEVDGFYQDKQGKKYFIKKPENFAELFAELLAGKLIEEFKRLNLIPEKYHDSLIVADVIDLGKGEFALIQPALDITELFKIIGTGSTDRNVPLEIMHGVNLYRLPFVKGERYFGLSMAFMVSLLLGDYSLHSANIVALPHKKSRSKRYGKIDWGAAFRDFVDPKNHADIFLPKEYSNLFSFSYLTKGFIWYYRDIPGFFSAVQEKAKAFFECLHSERQTSLTGLFSTMLQNCLTEIPSEILLGLNKKDIHYFGFTNEDLKKFCEDKLTFLETSFVNKFSKVLAIRLDKLMALNKSSLTYQSFKTDNIGRTADIYSSITHRPEQTRPSILQTSQIFFSSDESSQSDDYCDDYDILLDDIKNMILSHNMRNLLADPSDFIIEEHLSCPTDQQVPIKIPDRQITLSVMSDKETSLSYYLKHEANINRKERLIAMPLHVASHPWVAVIFYINADNQLVSVSVINQVNRPLKRSTLGVLSSLFKAIKIAYPCFNRAIHEYLFNKTTLSESNNSLALGLQMLLLRAYFGKHFHLIRYVAAHKSDVVEDCSNTVSFGS